MAGKIVAVLKQMTELLAAGQYLEAELLCKGIRLNARDMEAVIKGYGKALVPPPPSAFDSMDIGEVRGSLPRRGSVTMPLWTQQEGCSDLSIEATVTEGRDGCTIELDDIRVL